LAAIDAHSLPQRPDPLSRLWAFFARVKWLLGVVAILALGQAQPVKCERQTSDFGGDFAQSVKRLR
jgi:hypothetical protein